MVTAGQSNNGCRIAHVDFAHVDIVHVDFVMGDAPARRSCRIKSEPSMKPT
jgi:hypothetical protein